VPNGVARFESWTSSKGRIDLGFRILDRTRVARIAAIGLPAHIEQPLDLGRAVRLPKVRILPFDAAIEDGNHDTFATDAVACDGALLAE
jgi:hypothetical protein